MNKKYKYKTLQISPEVYRLFMEYKSQRYLKSEKAIKLLSANDLLKSLLIKEMRGE